MLSVPANEENLEIFDKFMYDKISRLTFLYHYVWCIPEVSNLFDRRAKCINFKLVGGQIEMLKASRGKGMGRECPQNGEGVSPSPAD